ncbi:hypothetical protein F511_43127 [Dorcoceras hygrometricum]|uniref:Uncharacterized protein n=1 Tax=Dorcoceras hygrometricum TaxID=472368 RepID=A0A2Z7BYJ8_9LAMI|nr:hypothetical protein F511_43127 [Dorcoceras hygrometricum]
MREEATSYGDSADGLVGDDVIGDVIQSQDSAGSLLSRGSDVVEEEIQQRATVHQQMLLKIAIAKRCRLHKLIRQRFALCVVNSAGRLCVVISADEATVIQVATQRYSVEDFQTLYLMNQSQDSVAIFQQKRVEKQQSLYQFSSEACVVNSAGILWVVMSADEATVIQVATQRYSVEDFQTLYLMNQSQDSVAIFQQKREEKQQSLYQFSSEAVDILSKLNVNC